ncbi:response regulator [Actibacterium lipolyticum]|uniref:Regulatory protein VirG n=1 Tax=Actibacterium lipolyticum TaxID=1524263 RepID=A0A238KIF2_9RHOB|nr:response regulator [Actibacterium lipolyticum]SMX42448.1 Transcriptional regulatory protein OmpR [Actibacterium lipolyticum]
MVGKKVLVVDDDPKIRALIRKCLDIEGLAVVEAADVPSAFAQLESEAFDLITLDLHLGGGDGFDVARQVRYSSDIPIIMVTGKDDVIDRVVGLEIGADDYITKPFHVREFLARVRSVLRRAETRERSAPAAPETPADPEAGVEFDGLIARSERLELLDRDGTAIELTSGDFKLLNAFLQNPKKALSRERIMDLIDGPEWNPLDRTIDNQVARLRKKIERDPMRPALIKTVRGVGYILAADVVRTGAGAASKRA